MALALQSLYWSWSDHPSSYSGIAVVTATVAPLLATSTKEWHCSEKEAGETPTAALTLDYDVGHCLGEPGAFGLVYSVTDRSTGEKLAAKVLMIPPRCSPSYKKLKNLYRREISILGSLSHPGIVRLERVICTGSYLYLVMERCWGGDLFDYISARGGKIEEQEAASIFRQVLEPVAYLHNVAGVAHCDIKLGNIMFASRPSVHNIKLIDFGLSSRCQAGAILTGRSGTTAFMAPEQLKQEYGVQVDMWSLGVVLFIIIFGYSPWDPYCIANPSAIRSLIRQGFRNETKTGHGPWFPEGIPASDLVKDLIGRLLRYNPNKRITACEALHHPWLQSFS